MKKFIAILALIGMANTSGAAAFAGENLELNLIVGDQRVTPNVPGGSGVAVGIGTGLFGVVGAIVGASIEKSAQEKKIESADSYVAHVDHTYQSLDVNTVLQESIKSSFLELDVTVKNLTIRNSDFDSKKSYMESDKQAHLDFAFTTQLMGDGKTLFMLMNLRQYQERSSNPHGKDDDDVRTFLSNKWFAYQQTLDVINENTLNAFVSDGSKALSMVAAYEVKGWPKIKGKKRKAGIYQKIKIARYPKMATGMAGVSPMSVSGETVERPTMPTPDNHELKDKKYKFKYKMKALNINEKVMTVYFAPPENQWVVVTPEDHVFKSY